MKKIVYSAIALMGSLIIFSQAPAQQSVSYLSFGIAPGITIPLGTSSDRYNTGGIGTITIAYKPGMGFRGTP